jgi:DNA-binding NarL/FixJ family response regulator
MSRPRVLLADDHRIVAEGLRHILSAEFDLVGIAEDGRELVEAARTLRPDVIVADIAMPHMGGLEALAELKRDDPGVRVVFLTMHAETAYARRALASGALGFVLKHSAPAELVLAVRSALEGRTYVTSSLAGELLRPAGREERREPGGTLTLRQREILQLLAAGRSAKEIGAVLGISSRTVEFHKYRMMEILGLHSSAELIHFAIKNGIVPG